MAKIRRPDLGLRQSLVLYVLAFALLAVLLSLFTSLLCQQAKDGIWEKYTPNGEKYYLTNSRGERLGEGAYIGVQPVELSAADRRWYAFWDTAQQFCVAVYSAVCLIAAALLFYRRKLKRPLAELQLAAEKIAANDLDFRVRYACGDELGRLCRAFETMRARLAGNFAEMWERVEERKQLNAAFAHDLRTPLTVLKGYNEMLLAGAGPTGQTEAAWAMQRHIARLEALVESMSRLQRLEELRPERRPARLSIIADALRESAQMICGKQGRELSLPEPPLDSEVWIDPEFVSRVSNNLVDNAARYAQSRVSLTVAAQDGGLLLTVTDDGPGFAPESLARAANPYFTGEAARGEHFGLGLYICQLHCQRHGGCLRLANAPGGGAEARALFK